MTVLVCTDFTIAAAAGEREAVRRFPDARLIVFHAVDVDLIARVVQLTGQDGAELKRAMVDFADLRLKEIVERMGPQAREAVADLVTGRRVDATLAAAERHHADAIILGAVPAEGDEGSMGRFRASLARRARVPLQIVPA